LIGDEALNTYAKLTPPPRAFPVEAHLRGLAGHIAWTSTAEGVIQLLEFVADEEGGLHENETLAAAPRRAL
jgi:hypothetical protein